MITFDGVNKVITLESGVTEVEAIDIYSRWKEWVAISDNAKFDPAFRTVGGDPLSSIINAGSYFFLRNDLGWRIKPPEEDITVLFAGNLAIEDTTQTSFIPTTGPFTATVLGLQPITQGVTESMRSQLEYGSFQGGVTLDTINGFSGSFGSDGLTPVGTSQYPAVSLAQAQTIATSRGFSKIFVIGDYSFLTTDNIDGFEILGQSESKTTINLEEDANITNCIFRNATISGFLDGGNDIFNCRLEGINYIDGIVFDSEFSSGDIVLNGSKAEFIRCYSGVAGGGTDQTPVIDMGGTGTDLIIRDYHGGLLLKNYTSGNNNISIDMSSGRIIFDSTITSGTHTVRGIGTIEDNSTGTSTINAQILDPSNLNRSAFTDGGVYLMQGSAHSGTTFPVGTPIKPVNNLNDAISIANNEGLIKIFITGELTATATENLDGITVIGGSGAGNVLTLSGATTNNSGFERLTIVGALNGLSRMVNCVLGVDGTGGFTGCQGHVLNCIINSTEGISQQVDGMGTLFDNCSFVAPGDPQITLDANSKGFSLRGCTGNILISNGTATEQQQLNLNGARLEIDSTCTAGTYHINGLGELTDNSTGTTIINKLDSVRIDEMWKLQGLDAENNLVVNNTSRSAGADVNQSISDSSGTITVSRS